MSKTFALAILLLVLVGCASNRSIGDFALQGPNSSTLVFADDLPPLPGGGGYFAIPGYVFVADRMVLHPGKHRITYACPGKWDWQDITHYTPWVDHVFESGKWYELQCSEGHPRIEEIARRY